MALTVEEAKALDKRIEEAQLDLVKIPNEVLECMLDYWLNNKCGSPNYSTAEFVVWLCRAYSYVPIAKLDEVIKLPPWVKS